MQPLPPAAPAPSSGEILSQPGKKGKKRKRKERLV
jgi:hypothetical protein